MEIQPRPTVLDESTIERMLEGTSRTFALTVPLLAPPLRVQVGSAYLLFRIADSIEDAPDIDTRTRVELLDQLRESIHSQWLTEAWTDATCSTWPTSTPLQELFQAANRLLATIRSFPTEARHAILDSVETTIGGMQWFLHASEGSGRVIQMSSIADLQRYCFFVAGVVGEMLTDLFVQSHPASQRRHAELRRKARSFGEALQLTNILKDSGDDDRDQRVFIPQADAREAVFDMAYAAMEESHEYVEILREEQFSRDIVRFCECPLLLAEETLAVVRQNGPGSKVDRGTVMRIFAGQRS